MGDGFGLKCFFARSTICSKVRSVTCAGDARVFNSRYVDGPTAFSRIALCFVCAVQGNHTKSSPCVLLEFILEVIKVIMKLTIDDNK